MIGVDIVTLPGSSTTGLGVTDDVLQAANQLSRRPLFDLRVVSAVCNTELRRGVTVRAHDLQRVRPRQLVIMPGIGAATPQQLTSKLASADVVLTARWLKRAHQRGAHVAASCSAVFVLAEAGLLAHRACTSTWWLVPVLKAHVPTCDATIDAMVVEAERVWTAGAAFAHIDLMLALVSRFGSAALASDVASHLVVEPRSSQARFLVPSFLAAHDPLASKLEALVRRSLPTPPSLDEMAHTLGLGARTLSRRIVAATGLSPMRLVQKVRVDTALHLLSTTRYAVEEVAQRVGFEDASALYRLILRHTGKPPSSFRTRPS
jgi:transcriptional regulator GlxA family with amidase domain